MQLARSDLWPKAFYNLTGKAGEGSMKLIYPSKAGPF